MTQTLIGKAIDACKSFYGTGGLYSREDLEKLYERDMPSFASKLPYGGYDSETGTFVLEDFISRAACLTISPIATEGRPTDRVGDML